MAVAKSPFKIYRQFISPKLCDTFIDRINFFHPDVDSTGNPVKMFKFDEEIQETIYTRLMFIVPELEQYYDCKYQGTEEILTEWFDVGTIGKPQCENSHFLKNKWIRSRTRDLSAILFMCDYQNAPNFDSDYEVYGGKLEFPQHKFSFNPERGTLIVYPSDPHFINATSLVQAGELYQARIHIATKTPYLYDPSKFPGDFQTWFSGLY